jgi:ribosomal protein S18 acetylase RimI-like enzyme
VAETGLAVLSAQDAEAHEACARLHEAILPHSAPARFGRRFMTGFYLPKLLGSGLIAGDLFRVEGRAVGFNLYTRYPETFLREGIRRHFPFLAGFMPVVFLSRPRALLGVWEMLRNRGGFPAAETPRTGYWLTFGVEPDARRLVVEGKSVARHLVDRMFDYFRGEGYAAVEGTVERGNAPALFFYRTCGFAFEDRGLGEGAKLQVRYTFR